MQPTSNMKNQPQFELPRFQEGQEKQRERSREEPSDKESAAGKAQPPAADAGQLAVPDLSAVQVSAPPITIPVQDKTDDTVPGQPAADTDRIEREWVDRAKAIVARTRDDPHQQKKEISQVKADYIRKRFGKAVPTDDAVTA